jgi:Rrf2 family transcriptional regulator, iron-sulfur cluster assembly transcription factor
MFALSRQTDYASRIILHLSLSAPGVRISAREVAAARLIPASLVRRIVSQLAVAGLLKTSRGKEGGITLARAPSEISLLDVVQVMEGELLLNPCVGDPDGCPLSPRCSVHETWVMARSNLVDSLRSATFDQLAARSTGLSRDPLPSTTGVRTIEAKSGSRAIITEEGPYE